jgi:hypothetical protein
MTHSELRDSILNFKTTSTPLEERVADIICQPDFSFTRFIKISEPLIRRQSRRRERIRLNEMNKTDEINGFIRSDFPRLTRFGN